MILSDLQISESFFLNSDEQELHTLFSGWFSCQYRNVNITVNEEIYKNATLRLKRTEQPYHYELVVSTTESLKDDIYDDQQCFQMDESMELCVTKYSRSNENICLTWCNKDNEETFIFVFDSSVSHEDIKLFMLLSYECIYEAKYENPRSKATAIELEQFLPSQDSIKLMSNVLKKQESYQNQLDSRNNKRDSLLMDFSLKKLKAKKRLEFNYVSYQGCDLPTKDRISNYICNFQADLFEYLPNKQSFELKETCVHVLLVQLQENDFNFALAIIGDQIPHLSQVVDHQMNPSFNKMEKSFKWNYHEDNRQYTFSINISAEEVFDEFSAAFSQCLFEISTQTPFTKSKKSDQNYILYAFKNDIKNVRYNNDALLEDITDGSNVGAVIDEPKQDNTVNDTAFYSNKYYEDDYEDQDETNEYDVQEFKFYERHSNTKNTILCSGNSSNRSFVFKDNNVAIYEDENYQNSIESIQSLCNNNVTPGRVMLYQKESSCLFLDENNNQNSVYNFDFNTGKVIQEWKFENEDPLIDIVPSYKSASQKDEHIFCGITSNAIFHVDPRQPGNSKIVDHEYKKHITKTDFSVAATTESGYLAVASKRGEIRLFNALNTMAKTTLPVIGQTITHLDVSNCGRYILATCDGFIMLIDVEAKGCNYYETSTTHTSDRPIPVILKLQPEHSMLMGALFGFKNAQFDIQDNNKIIATVGNYLISWNMNKIHQGYTDSYKIQKFDSPILSCKSQKSLDRVLVLFKNNLMQTSYKRFSKPSFYNCLSDGIATLKQAKLEKL